RDIDRTHSQGELSFWLAFEAWGHGYMSEVVQAVVQYGFENLDLNRLYAYHMLRNPASGRVLEKSGFKQEGLLRQRVRKWGQFEDVLLWANLRQEWQDELDK
ncbi:MAG: GNAT family N-acetyltransferase, partial [Candidatus Thiodiazotropha sp. (ex Lucinoma borealis)]|nr:GNAT family N-acetyltransferase [Candidatus Thiodiazotropha sp. (ex Lucinoma borealis)]